MARSLEIPASFRDGNATWGKAVTTRLNDVLASVESPQLFYSAQLSLALPPCGWVILTDAGTTVLGTANALRCLRPGLDPTE